MRRAYLYGLTTLSTALAACAPALAGAPEAALVLAPKTPVERPLAPGGTDRYQVRLRSGEVIKVSVEQRAVDVALALKSPAGVLLRTVDSPTGGEGTETLEWLAAETGVYRLEVAALADSKPGRYVVRLEEIRKASREQLADAQAERELRKAAMEWEAAQKAPDEQVIRRLAGPAYQRYDGPGEAGRSLDQVLAYSKQRPVPQIRRKLEDVAVRASANSGLVTFRLLSTFLLAGRESTYPVHVVQYWQRRGGRWLVAEERGYDADPLPRTPRFVTISEAVQKGYAGNYEGEDGVKIAVESAGDHLLYRFSDAPHVPAAAMYPESEVEFTFKGDLGPGGQVSLIFVHDPKGRLMHALLMTSGRARRFTPKR